MDKTFDLLEERIRKTATVVERLRKDNATLEQELKTARRKLEEADKRPKGAAPDAGRVSALEGEVGQLRQEREEIRTRIGRLVEILDKIE
jgi:predicted  nucleic acid-binding Zn-ribbon protein